MSKLKYEILNRFSGALIFEAEINCQQDASISLKMGLAVKAALAAEADLSGADLSGADLSGAKLSWAKLSGAKLSGADLRYIKHDIWGILLHARAELPALRQALVEGRINGSVYRGECACLCGTIANVRGCDVQNANAMTGISPDSGSMAERFFMGIKTGDTPDNNGASKMVLQWIDEFQKLVA